MSVDTLTAEDIENGYQLSWSELAELNHETQVRLFNFCTCEDNEGNENPYADCPRPDLATMTRTFFFWEREMRKNV